MSDTPQDRGLPRRNFLVTVSLAPLAIALGCGRGAGPAEAGEALRRFIYAIGPWTVDQRAVAEEFVDRFLAANGVAGDLLEHGVVAENLASEQPFRDGPWALDELDLSPLSKAERELLLDLVTQIYGLLEVHHVHVAGIPNLGVCAGREQYKLAPVDWLPPYRATDG